MGYLLANLFIWLRRVLAAACGILIALEGSFVAANSL